MPVHLPGNPSERVVFRPAPRDYGVVRDAKRPIVTPMCGRGYIAPGKFQTLDATDRSKWLCGPDAELDIGEVAWPGAIDEYVLSVEGDRTALCSCVDLIEQRPES